MPLVSNNGSSTLLEIYDYIGDCITGRDKELIDWEKEFIDKERVRDILNQYHDEEIIGKIWEELRL